MEDTKVNFLFSSVRPRSNWVFIKEIINEFWFRLFFSNLCSGLVTLAYGKWFFLGGRKRLDVEIIDILFHSCTNCTVQYTVFLISVPKWISFEKYLAICSPIFLIPFIRLLFLPALIRSSSLSKSQKVSHLISRESRIKGGEIGSLFISCCAVFSDVLMFVNSSVYHR